MNKQIIFMSIMLLIPTIATPKAREYSIHNDSGKTISISRYFNTKEEILAPNEVKKISEDNCFDMDEGTICSDKVSWKINGITYDHQERIGEELNEELHIKDDGKYTLSHLNNYREGKRIIKSSR